MQLIYEGYQKSIEKQQIVFQDNFLKEILYRIVPSGTGNNVLVIDTNYERGKDVKKSRSESVYTRDIILCRGKPSFSHMWQS
jgi:polygalacturonase